MLGIINKLETMGAVTTEGYIPDLVHLTRPWLRGSVNSVDFKSGL